MDKECPEGAAVVFNYLSENSHLLESQEFTRLFDTSVRILKDNSYWYDLVMNGAPKYSQVPLKDGTTAIIDLEGCFE